MAGRKFDVRRASSAVAVGDGGSRVVRTPVSYGNGNLPLNGRFSSKCSVCRSPWIADINALLLFGNAYKSIVMSLPEEAREDDHPLRITPRMIENHAKKGHLPIREMKVQAIINERLETLGIAIAEHEGFVLDQVIMGRVMMEKYFERLVQDLVTPDTGDIIQVMKMFAAMDAMADGGIDTQAYSEVITVMISVIRTIAPEKFDEIMYRVSNNPVVRGVIERERQAQELEP